MVAWFGELAQAKEAVDEAWNKIDSLRHASDLMVGRVPWLAGSRRTNLANLITAETYAHYAEAVLDPCRAHAVPIREVWSRKVAASRRLDLAEAYLTPLIDAICGPPTEPRPVPFWRADIKPYPMDLPVALYSTKAKAAGIEGRAVVDALVDTNGTIISTKVLRSSGHATLDSAAIRAARRARFTTGEYLGKPVRVWVSIPYRFPPYAGTKR